MQNILITGGTGLIGKKLLGLLTESGYGVHVFTRNANSNENSALIRYFSWDPAKGTYDKNALTDVVGIVNLAGAGIADKRWTIERKKAIQNSRIQSGNTIAKALLENPNQVEVLLQASAIGWYPPEASDANATFPNTFQEELSAHTDFLGQTCLLWEQSVAALQNTKIRIAFCRIGIVLDQNGGMVKELKKPIQFGIQPVFGNGRQIISWIHSTDLCAGFLYAIQNNSLHGAYNLVAPQPVMQKKLVKKIAAVLYRRWGFAIPVPAWFLKIILGEMSIEILKSSTIRADKIIKAGFRFRYPALDDIDHL